MREILFRGKRIDNSEWVFGDLRHDYDHAPRCISDYCGANPVDPNTVGQYTGLTDTNGKKIFEGDILKWDAEEWGKEYCEPVVWDYSFLGVRQNDWQEFCEVIGNIHDNKELLNGN